MMTITTKTLWTRRGVRWARRDLLLLLLLACLGPPLVVSQGGHDVMPATSFSCIGKVIGGYYADVEAGCQMFHVCTLNEKAKVHDYTFRCLAGTVFDQETRVCERTDEVDCSRSRSFYYLNNDLYGPGIIPSTAHIRVIDEGEERQRTVGQARTADISTTTTTTPAPRFVFPETSFSCVDKILGGLYADVELGCAVFHICSVEPNAGVKDNKFECGRGTLFDQSTRTCQIAALVDCAAAPSFYYLNDRHNLPDGSSVDLCRSRALGSPLADITTGCQYYTVCQAGEGGKLVESRVACKKDFLFSQLLLALEKPDVVVLSLRSLKYCLVGVVACVPSILFCTSSGLVLCDPVAPGYL